MGHGQGLARGSRDRFEIGLAVELVLGATSSPRMNGLLPLSVNKLGLSANETETWPPALEIVAGMIANVEPTPPVIIWRSSSRSGASEGVRSRRVGGSVSLRGPSVAFVLCEMTAPRGAANRTIHPWMRLDSIDQFKKDWGQANSTHDGPWWRSANVGPGEPREECDAPRPISAGGILPSTLTRQAIGTYEEHARPEEHPIRLGDLVALAVREEAADLARRRRHQERRERQGSPERHPCPRR